MLTDFLRYILLWIVNVPQGSRCLKAYSPVCSYREVGELLKRCKLAEDYKALWDPCLWQESESLQGHVTWQDCDIVPSHGSKGTGPTHFGRELLKLEASINHTITSGSP